MKVSRLNASLLVLLLTLFSITATAQPAEDPDDEVEDYDVKARVVRISMITGDVSLKRNGNTDWERARLNYPLVEGDTVATDKEGRMEIQVDARNFVRLAPGTALRIVTLRDEGIALSVLEGTAFVRLVNFDRSRGYFEVDAPRTTMAAEKPGLYRIDAPREGRVRLTVRDGGSARIYSDTSGFSLRDGRSAELVVEGENAGDWEFLAMQTDALDEWVSDRERYLAQRLRYDVEYYDEHVWGAEDLAAYGEWTYTSDFGWIWRPHAAATQAYADWAPYRHGHWVWVSPYGWTWVGYEPWGWAPYHYGRWVFHNHGWAWVPRSKFQRTRSWWRPALVAFVSLNFSIGNNICWYPLDYYQRDPHSRRYRRHDRRPSHGGRGSYAGGRPSGGRPGRDGRPNGRPGYPNGRPGNTGGRPDNPEGRPGLPVARDDEGRRWHGVTRVPLRDFGNENERALPVDERVARRVLETEPDLSSLPQRRNVPDGGATGLAPSSGGSGATAGRNGAVNGNGGVRRGVPRRIELPDSPTGAAERTPGVALDEDLRRSRIFRGREPRPVEPVQTNTQTSSTPNNSSTPAGGGAVARPEPRSPLRESERPRIETQSEPRISDSPRPEPRRVDRSPSESRPERRDSPRSEPVPRVETPRSEPAPRDDTPRSQPAPRVETPRSQPAPRVDTPRTESRPEPRRETPRSDPPPRVESPRSNPPPRSEPPARVESPRNNPPPRNDPPPRNNPPPRNDP
ncbi:MAG TPA: DUF6600 domain-containing protein, partial [Pyrinomonadaceae bacterium]